MNANWAHEFTKWSCSFTARHGSALPLPLPLSINPILFLHLLEIITFLVQKSSRLKVSSICWWCVTVATALLATKVSAAGSMRASEKEPTTNVLDGNQRGEEVHRESSAISKGSIRNEGGPRGAAHHAETSESEHRTSRSHSPHSKRITQGLFTAHKDKQYCLKLPVTIRRETKMFLKEG